MAETAPRLATYEDILNLPEHLVGEILDDELVVSPRPAPRHARSSTGIIGDIDSKFGHRGGGPWGPGGWWILDEPELHLGRDVVVPDIAGWRRQRMPAVPEEAFFTQAPDWVCEVISKSTEKYDRTRKMRIYAREKVGYFWIVNPLLQTLEVRRLAGEFWQDIAQFSGDESVRAEPFEEVELQIARWWETE